ncbi:MAG: hypothetical protein CL908_22380 [Deltaproteobacteria bacterium]|nr:hypothetical protein [Deltaproteobacteria bacterium]
MNRFDLLRRLPTVVRSLRRLRVRQALAQAQHMMVGPPAPRRATGAAPILAIDCVETSFLQPPAHVHWRGEGSIELLATPFELGDRVDWETRAQGPLFAYHLHQHDYLRCPGATPLDRSERIRDWIRRHPRGVGWDPHPISLRLLTWGKLLASPGALELSGPEREEILASLADQAETLAQGLEVRLQANHLLSNLISVVWAGLLLDGRTSDAWRALATRLVQELDDQIRPDGGHEERSPMYHALLLENLLDLLNLCLAAPRRAPHGLEQTLRDTTQRMLAALDVVTPPDGRIALFADSGFDIAAESDSLRDYASRLGVRTQPPSDSVHLPQTGYLRLRAGDFALIASVAGPSPRHQPGHAHCDALSFVLSVGGQRLVTDTGCFEYRPGTRRDRARATASHATLQLDGEEQAELWAAHRIGGRPSVEVVAWDASGVAEAICRGWSAHAALHRRRFEVCEAGVTIRDGVEGPCREVRACLPIDPAWRVELALGVARATRIAAAGCAESVTIELPEGFTWSLEQGPYYPSFGREEERFVLVGVGEGCREAVTRFRCGG